MTSIWNLKERAATETPLFLFDFELASGQRERWCTHGVELEGVTWAARIVSHNFFEMRSDADEGIDSLSRLSVTLANADSYCSQIERNVGWKGAKVTVRFLFFDLKHGSAASEGTVVFRGVANPPDEITESTLRLTITNRMNFQRMLLPEVRIQRRCPWKFPATAEQRAEGATGGMRGKYSPFYRCGYSPDIEGGVGSLDGTAPFESCDYTRPQCEQRGMFGQDASSRATGRFGGIEFVPPSVLVRTYGDKAYHVSALVENEGRYNDFVPIVYGTGWISPPIVFARNDGNLTRMEVLLGMGEIQGVLRVVVNDIEIPPGRAGTNMTATGWHNLVSPGSRTGAFNSDFTDAEGKPLGDPYGSMAYLSIVVPNRVNDAQKLPKVQVLLEGLKVARYASNGAYLSDEYDNNPAWVILDILRRSGWNTEEIDLGSFAEAAAYCAADTQASDLYGNPAIIPRFQCNLVLRRRRSVAEVIRGIRSAARLYLSFDAEGRLQLRCENTIAQQQPVKPAGSNSEEPLNGGWPGYEFGDGTSGFSSILRKSNGEPAIRFYTRSAADSPNRYSVEFQDAFNDYQQDSLSLVDVDDVLRTGQEISATLGALGVPNFHQAARIIQLQLDKSIRGNTYVQFETSVRGVGLRPGDIITLTYLKEGLQRQPFRIKSIAPGVNYRTVTITAQIHSDEWYTDIADGSGSGRRRQPGFEVGLPRPLMGNTFDEEGEPQFEITETIGQGADGQTSVSIQAGFIAPRKPSATDVGIPLVKLAASVSDSGGTLGGDQTLYYALSAVAGDDAESPLSFLVRATIPPGTNTNRVELTELSFAPGTTGFHVYRGKNPAHLFLIAAAQPVADTFADSGLPSQPAGPPDENYDHANFYWRLELQPEEAATIHSASTIGNAALQMTANAYRGAVVRITRGKGRGQERVVLANDATTLELTLPWETEPDSTSRFTVAEAGWRFGAMGRTGPVEFDVPNRVGATIHVSGRSANVNDKECAYELSPLTRWRIGSASGAPVDLEPPPPPVFGLLPTGRGSVELTGIAFEDLTNTRTVSAGTLTLHYWPELASPSQVFLDASLGAEDTTIHLSATGGAQPGSLIQIDAEILAVMEVLNGGLEYVVQRGVYGSQAEAHATNVPVYGLSKKVYILPFTKDFFGSPASGNLSFPIYLPDARIACAEFTATNMKGESAPSRVCYTITTDNGLRTLAGGQLSIQVEGYLAIQSDVAPPLVVEASHAAGDILAIVREAPTGGPLELRLRQNEETYCQLTIAAGATISNVVNGFGLPPLVSSAQLSLDILSVPEAGAGTPGRDLTVTIRL
ncbi:MAG: phage tail protein [Bryobacteraceae bacterium]